MKILKYLLGLIIISVILMSLNVNSAFVVKDKIELINAYNNRNLIRLHVVANSNSPLDQYLKRRVRDEVINFMAGYADKESLLSNLGIIEEHVQQELKKESSYLPLEVHFGNFYFPRRTYGNMTLPEGEYKALKIILGKGEGSNWWCVLSPPLCIDEVRGIGKTKAKVEFRFKLVDLLKGLITGNKEKNEIDNPAKMIDKLNIINNKGRFIRVSVFHVLRTANI